MDTKAITNTKNENIYRPIHIVWPKAMAVSIFHILAVCGVFMYASGRSSLQSYLFFWMIAIIGSLGIQCGAHRLWSHRCYKAKLPLKIILMIFDTIAFQGDVYDWSRDHRVHHKFSDTDADPYNSSRGFFFCHMGWVFVKKHQQVKEKGKTIDMSDLLADSVVRFQHKYYSILVLVFWAIIPITTAMYLFSETFFSALCGNTFRYVLALHLTWTVNSVAHLYGMRPYDNTIEPRNSFLVTHWALGEGYHNYHHVFPYDYSASEFGWKLNWNPATTFIDLFHWIGWATELKAAPQQLIKSRKERTGDNVLNKMFSNINYWTDVVIGIIGTFSPLLILVVLKFAYFSLVYQSISVY